MEVVDAPGREEEVRAFSRLVGPVLARGLRQTGKVPLTDGQTAELARELLRFGDEGGWEMRFGTRSQEIPPVLLGHWLRRLGERFPDRADELGAVFKQVLKSIFQPAPEVCRNSFREADSAGRCRRQERLYDLNRLSGAHCVDCPYWTEKSGEEHLAWLSDEWRTGAAVLLADRDVYLPEDFRALRRWRPTAILGI